MTPSAHVILNPRAGGGGAGRLRSELERNLTERNVRYTIEETMHVGHATELAERAASGGIDRLLVVGGDGTVHEAANGLLRSGPDPSAAVPVLGVIPAGTGNDFIKMVCSDGSRRRAYDIAAADSVRRFDVGRVTWAGGSEYFVNGMGLGIDVEVVRQIERVPRLPGVIRYFAGLIRALAIYKPVALRLELDDGEIEERVMIIAVGNGACVGGGFRLCPGARPDDGRFDVCIVEEIGWIQIARVVPRILRGTHGGMRGVTLRQTAQARIEATGAAALFFQVDGELRQPAGARWLQIELEREALPVLAPTTDERQ